MQPEVSIVVVPFAGRDHLLRCLTALSTQRTLLQLQIIVPHDQRLPDVATLIHDFPSVEFLGVDGQRTFAELRALGVKSARSEIVALTEDHCTPDADWCVRIKEAHKAPYAAIGGAVEKAVDGTDSSWSWAVYLSDWGRYMGPLSEGPARSLTDCNVTYKYAALTAIAQEWSTEFHEPVVHAALQARGESLWLAPQIVVRQHRSLSPFAAIRERYAFGRLFGATRVPKHDWTGRLFFSITSCLLPGLLISRVAANVLNKGRHRAEFMRALPALIVLSSVWAWGELVGYVAGSPAASLLTQPWQRTLDTRAQNGLSE
ncbi:MAG: glycosyltransferase family 2 protein [Chloroflexota bacterium]